MVTGHIRKRTTKNGKPSYQIILETERDPITGKRQRLYETVNGTKKEAEAHLNRRIHELSNGGIILKASALKLEDWMDEWLNTYVIDIAVTTREGYAERIRNRLNPYLGKYPLSTLNTKIVQEWVNTLNREGLAPKSIKNVFLNLKAALDKAESLDMIPKNPCNQAVLPKMVKYQASVYNESEIQKLLRASEGTDMYLIVAIELVLGLRRGELAALKWSDIDFQNGVVHIHSNCVVAGSQKITKAPKSKAGIRDIATGSMLLNILSIAYQSYLAKTQQRGFVDSGYVIHKDDGTPYNPESITQKWVRFRHENQLRDIRLHDLRHTCATTMLAKGVDVKTIQARLGHSDVQTTLNIYTHSLPSMNKAAGDTLDSLFG